MSLKLDQKLVNDMKIAVQHGEQILNQYFGQVLNIETKHKAGLVTQADRESEQVIAKTLEKMGYSFLWLGEESAGPLAFDFLKQNEKPCWILDPLDGTTNFIHGLPVFAISLALFYQGQVVAGIVSAPKMGGGECYWALKGQGAYLNSRLLKVSGQAQLQDAFVATGFFAEEETQLQEQLPIFSNLVRKTRAIRRAGAAAYDLALVARGTFDAFWERGLKPWDTGAGSLLVQEAGGVVQSYRARPYHPLFNSIVAGSVPLVQDIQNQMSPYIHPSSD